MFWKKGVKVIIACNTRVTKTPIVRNLLNLNIDLPLIINARAMWEITRRLKIMVLESVCEYTPSDSLKTKRKIKAKERPVTRINIRRWLLRIGALGFLGFSFKTS